MSVLKDTIEKYDFPGEVLVKDFPGEFKSSPPDENDCLEIIQYEPNSSMEYELPRVYLDEDENEIESIDIDIYKTEDVEEYTSKDEYVNIEFNGEVIISSVYNYDKNASTIHILGNVSDVDRSFETKFAKMLSMHFDKIRKTVVDITEQEFKDFTNHFAGNIRGLKNDKELYELRRDFSKNQFDLIDDINLGEMEDSLDYSRYVHEALKEAGVFIYGTAMASDLIRHRNVSNGDYKERISNDIRYWQGKIKDKQERIKRLEALRKGLKLETFKKYLKNQNGFRKVYIENGEIVVETKNCGYKSGDRTFLFGSMKVFIGRDNIRFERLMDNSNGSYITPHISRNNFCDGSYNFSSMLQNKELMNIMMCLWDFCNHYNSTDPYASIENFKDISEYESFFPIIEESERVNQ